MRLQEQQGLSGRMYVVGRAETFRSVMYAARRKFTFDTIFGRSLIIVPLGPEAAKLNELFDANEFMESFVQQKLEDMNDTVLCSMEPGQSYFRQSYGEHTRTYLQPTS